MTRIQYVVLYKVKEPDTTYYYAELKMLQTLSYQNLRGQGWRNAKVGDKKECNRFLEFVKKRRGVIFAKGSKGLPTVFIKKSYEAA